jgi:hypothetical protein
MRIHDVFHVNLLRPFRRRGGEKGAPPALMPSGETQYEVQEILSHLDDTDNERWYEVRWDDGSISSIPERDAYNCWERVEEYFAKHGLNAKRPPRPSKRTQQSLHKETKQTSAQAIPDMNTRAESLRATAEQPEPDSGWIHQEIQEIAAKNTYVHVLGESSCIRDWKEFS